MPLTSHLLMIEPTVFGFNEIASESNSFQNKPDLSREEVQNLALSEFLLAVEKLRNIGVNVSVFRNIQQDTPDSIFPNNWISTHATGELILYPMAVSNRRAERREDIVVSLCNQYNYRITDLSFNETAEKPMYLEGTGSLIFDHDAKVVYAAISPRTHQSLVAHVADLLGYESVCFHAYGKSGERIYHTNVMMCIGKDFVVIGDETIDLKDRKRVMDRIQSSNKEIIRLTNEQVYNHFAGNMLQIANVHNESILVMSETALHSLTTDQRMSLVNLNDHIISLNIPTIEFVGGGSARCMLAEIFPIG